MHNTNLKPKFVKTPTYLLCGLNINQRSWSWLILSKREKGPLKLTRHKLACTAHQSVSVWFYNEVVKQSSSPFTVPQRTAGVTNLDECARIVHAIQLDAIITLLLLTPPTILRGKPHRILTWLPDTDKAHYALILVATHIHKNPCRRVVSNPEPVVAQSNSTRG